MVKTLFKLRVVNRKTHIVRQTERLKRGEINRRRFIMSALATGVTLPTATALAQRAEASQPKAGGILRIGFAHPQKNIELHALSTGNTLVEVASDGALVGDLAASFEPDVHAQRWVFHLHSGISFADGTALDASAVAAFLTQAETPGIRNQIKSIIADGANTVVIELNAPNSGFVWVLSDPALAIRAPSGAGTGSYVQSMHAQRLMKVVDHWKPGRGHFEAIDLIPLPDPAARLTALLNGEIDLMDDVDPGMFALLAHSPGIRVIEAPDAALYGFACENGASDGIGRALGDDNNRCDLAQKVLLGHGRARGGVPIDFRAPKRETIKLAPNADVFPGSREMVSFVSRMGRKNGVEIAVDPANPDFRTERRRLRPTLDWTLAEFLTTRPDPTLEELIHKVRSTQSADETSYLKEQAFAHLESQGSVYPLIANAIDAHKTTLTLPAGVYDPLRVAERGWFA
jgi:hypothetical protein